MANVCHLLICTFYDISSGAFESATVSVSPTSLQCARAEGHTKLIFRRACGRRHRRRYKNTLPSALFSVSSVSTQVLLHTRHTHTHVPVRIKWHYRKVLKF